MASIKREFLLIICLISSRTFFLLSSHALTDTLTPEETLTNNQTLVSAGRTFELGFFSDDFSGNHYIGIWFKADKNNVVWVGNREIPMSDSSGILHIRSGNLVYTDRRRVPWLLNSESVATAINTTATLLDTGNFVLKDEKSGIVLWQSFDNPTDTYLPGMKLGWSALNTNQPNFHAFVSWVGPQNPARGLFTLSTDRINLTTMQVWRGDNVQMDIGFWNGHELWFIFDNSSSENDYNFSRHSTADEAYFNFSGNKKYDLVWFVMASRGTLDQYFMVDGKISSVSHALCDNSTGRCLTSLPSMCEDGDSFSEVKGSLPSTFNIGAINMGGSDCETFCKSNCSCTAFASQQSDQECQLYYGSKQDLLKTIVKGPGIIHIRGTVATNGNRKWKLGLALAVPLAFLLVLIAVSLCCYLHWRKGHKEDSVPEGIINLGQVSLFQMTTNVSPVQQNALRGAHKMELGRQKDQDLPLFSFSTIQNATNYFAESNKLGEGGYGPVYKGKLLVEGQEIAVKRLSKVSRQGSVEFKNEVSVICKLQHRNLVRLLGCCIEAEESILVYEYMPNKSLDFFIFDSTKRLVLDWRKRVHIVEGIAQGLLYLHKYSRLRIIHRDLKTSNILLDSDMNPKISDFGMARIFGDNDTRGKTSRIVGTFGYMSPEYAMDGLFSEKSDVFSFGVILLEIISGKKNIAFFEADHTLNLLGKAWTLWREGAGMELMDSTLHASCSNNEVIRYIQMGLLCVQERAIDRPTMSDVVSLLSNQSFALPFPKEPAFLCQLSSTDADSSASRQRHYSQNDLTISQVHAR
ncbi:receptor-like serine/threonine-protein kinase SD1-8 [Argentina anserina]|uniref:receptor-like serine/threonine-protein kinase SD1-8 n=1 Tax=Argentina anserina TaxID=57926 RepID=UPI002176578B|nr:receptor-like serine/threonine-protein kinase SD1-8 [Potentilla anserina]